MRDSVDVCSPSPVASAVADASTSSSDARDRAAMFTTALIQSDFIRGRESELKESVRALRRGAKRLHRSARRTRGRGKSPLASTWSDDDAREMIESYLVLYFKVVSVAYSKES